MKVYAILVAGGRGLRFGGASPKQYLQLGGHYVFEYALGAFLAQGFVERIVLVVHEDYLAFWNGYLDAKCYGHRVILATAGTDRSHSVSNGLDALGALKEDDGVVVHDIVRPYVTDSMLQSVRSALEHYQAATFAIASTDTLLEVDINGGIIGSPDRSRYLRVQTPQCFCYQTLRDAFIHRDEHPGFSPTDEFGLVLVASKGADSSRFTVLEGDYRNIKITREEDMSTLLPFLQGLGSVSD